MDKELERRGHAFCRYADDCNVYARSRRAGERVMALLRRLYGRLHLTVNETKSAVTSVFGRKFLGYAFWAAPGGAGRRGQATGRGQGDQGVQGPYPRTDAPGDRTQSQGGDGTVASLRSGMEAASYRVV